ncbi:hypothetical protein [Botrimarina mediterranea]|uniref:Uncharacterized protein n=1 Tax=Botrimarina mediterranea TaxID=2528022 RepID=A0A518K448_9BACT|nr:hypothetical protein [Botrimarina mediterranea]QDV72562.1 hypothetical protein Spa11_07410 [Botrimarina mediterranea]QDV77134.1 hypothetical protein K2D_07220 [Planctomycetes bacterium K2D]
MAIDKSELDQFYDYAKAEEASSLEEALLRWRFQQGPRVQPAAVFAEGRSLRDRILDSGVLGSCGSLPVDLSTNPDYMNGFGVSGSALP